MFRLKASVYVVFCIWKSRQMLIYCYKIIMQICNVSKNNIQGAKAPTGAKELGKRALGKFYSGAEFTASRTFQ